MMRLDRRNRSVLAVLRERRGVVGLYFALVAGVMTLLMMAALDIMRVQLVRSRIVLAADSAVLAAGGSLGDANWANVGVAFFNANAASGMGGTFAITADDFTSVPVNGGVNQISLDFDADVSLLSAAFGTLDKLSLSVSNAAQRRSQSFELAMVLDNTGSMLGTNMDALKFDAQTLVNTLATNAVGGVLQNASVAIVPYATAVNAGAFAAALVPGQKVGTGVTDWWGCVIEPSSPNTLAIAPPANANWLRYKYPGLDDSILNIDNNYELYKALHWSIHAIRPDGKGYWRDYGNASMGPNLGCPYTPLTPLTQNVATLTNAVSAMQAWHRGGTSSDIGLAWGLRALAPNGPIATGAAFNGAVQKVIVFMTDGDAGYFKLRDIECYDWECNSPHADAFLSDYGGYGRIGGIGPKYDGKYDDRLGAKTIDEANKKINSNITNLCNSAKNTFGVQVFTITFGGKISVDTENIYRNCASDPAHYFSAPDQAALQTAFQSIGGALLELSIVR